MTDAEKMREACLAELEKIIEMMPSDEYDNGYNAGVHGSQRAIRAINIDEVLK